MASTKYLDDNGLLYFWQKIKNMFVQKDGDKVLSDNNYTDSEKTKLGNIAAGAEVNVIDSVKVNGTALTVTNKAVDIPTMTGATASAAGKVGVVPAPAAGSQGQFLRGDGTWATVSTADEKVKSTVSTANTDYPVLLNSTAKSDTGAVTAVSYRDTDVYVNPSTGTLTANGLIATTSISAPEATTTTAGLMSASDKTKLTNVEAGAEVNVIETVKVDGTALTPDANKAVDIDLSGKADLASPDFTGTPTAPTAASGTSNTQIANTQFVMSAIAAGGVTIDSALSDTSTNPVENRVITQALEAAGGSYAVGFTLNVATEPYTITTDKTFSEVYSAYQSGKIVYGVDQYDSMYELRNVISSEMSFAKVGIYPLYDGDTTIANSLEVLTVFGTWESSSPNSFEATVWNWNTSVIMHTLDSIDDYYAPIASPAFTGTPTVPTATAGTSTTQAASTAFVTNAIAAAQTGAATFKGTVNANTDISNLTDYKNGWYWVVATAGTYVGETCEIGDFIFCVSDRDGAYLASDFSVVQNNIDLTAITNAEIDTIVAA